MYLLLICELWETPVVQLLACGGCAGTTVHVPHHTAFPCNMHIKSPSGCLGRRCVPLGCALSLQGIPHLLVPLAQWHPPKPEFWRQLLKMGGGSALLVRRGQC